MGLWSKQKSEVRNQNEEHLLSADCLRRAAGPESGTCATTAYCLLHLREAGWKGHFGGVVALDKMSPPTGKERTRDVENRTSNAGMSLKTKDRCGKLGQEAGMSLKTKVVTR